MGFIIYKLTKNTKKMQIKNFIIASSILNLLLLLGCGRSGNKSITLEHSPSLVGSPPAPSFVLEKIEEDSGQVIYKRQETTTDSVFYLEVATYWMKAQKRVDTLQQWREAKVSKEELERQVLSIQYWIRELWSAFHRL